eukprot:scaffold15906_cov92-Skeletonema_dohrnii-CCMP3373.AAC.1
MFDEATSLTFRKVEPLKASVRSCGQLDLSPQGFALHQGTRSGTALAEPLDALERAGEAGEAGGGRGDSLGTQDANCECQGVSKNSDVKKYCHLHEL